MKKLLKKFLKVILIVIFFGPFFLVVAYALVILLEIYPDSGYTEEQLRILCNGTKNYTEFGLDTWDCMTVW